MPNDIEGVLAGDAGVVDDHFNVRIELVDRFPGGFGFGAADIGGGVQDLALEIGVIDRVEIDDTHLFDAGGGEIHSDGGPEAARADAEDAGGTNLLLAGEADFRKDKMARIAAN